MRLNNKLSGSVTLVGFMLLVGSEAYADGINVKTESQSMGHAYAGIFGGGGTVTGNNMSQQGTAFFAEASGGPLAVNAFGESDTQSTGVIGAHVGYQWEAQAIEQLNSKWRFAPATELEGYYLGNRSITGYDVNNDTARLDEHNFLVTYPTRTGVFLINGIMNINHSNLEKFHPYVGIGLGTAVMSVSGATSTQTAPAEPGINHYNSDDSDTKSSFAAQPKIGLSYILSKKSLIFVEYRFLYITSTDFTFGSTAYPTHAATTNWNVKIGAQRYNMGTIGFQYDL